MNDTFMKEKPVGPLLASMALPMVFSMLVNSLYNIYSVSGLLCMTYIALFRLAFASAPYLT